MNRDLLFIIFLAISANCGSDAFSCYQCDYAGSSSAGSSNCSEPFNGNVAGKCNATLCIWLFANYTYPQSFYFIYRGCTNDSSSTNLDYCKQQVASSNYTYMSFVSADTCCFATGLQQFQHNISGSQSTCICEGDYCNADPFPPATTSPLPPSSSSPATTATIKSTTTSSSSKAFVSWGNAAATLTAFFVMYVVAQWL